MVEDLRGDMEIVNSKSEDEDDEKEWDGDGGRVWDLVCFSVLFPIGDLDCCSTW